MRRGFTLIEMLLVIAIIGVLMGILIPAVSGARRTAQGAAGAANMRSLSQVQLMYTGEYSGEFFNAFTTYHIWRNEMPEIPRDSITPKDPYLKDIEIWRFNWIRYPFPQFSTDGFSPYWYSFMLHTQPNGMLPLETQISPADGPGLAALRRVTSTRAMESSLIPGSYLYAPMFWKPDDAIMYNFARTDRRVPDHLWPRIDGPNPDPKIARRRFLEEVTFPAMKVLLFERADFQQATRVRIEDGRGVAEGKNPGWSNPRAKPQVVTVDGAVRSADVHELTEAAAQSLASDPRRELVPVEIVRPPDAFPVLPNGAGFAIEDESNPGDGLYPYFFAGTRYGLKGRDLLR